MGIFGDSKKKEELLGTASSRAIITMKAYLSSRTKHQSKLKIFSGDMNFDDNINRVSEVIFLLGVYDHLVRCVDPLYEHLDGNDALGLLQAELVSNDEFTDNELWLGEAIKEGTYSQSYFKMNDRRIGQLDVLFVAGQLAYSKFLNKVDNDVPETMGIDTGYEFYDFKEFVELKNIVHEAYIKGLK